MSKQKIIAQGGKTGTAQVKVEATVQRLTEELWEEVFKNKDLKDALAFNNATTAFSADKWEVICTDQQKWVMSNYKAAAWFNY